MSNNNVPLGLTPQQKRALDFVRDYNARNNGVSPTYSEIADALGLRSRGNVNRLICDLEARGHVRRSPGLHRSLALCA